MQKRNGAQGRNRTTDTVIFSHVLYQLSYLGLQEGAAFIEARFRPVQDAPERRAAKVQAPESPAPHACPGHSTLIPASLISGPHLSISDLRNARSSSGADPITVTPS